MFRVLTEEEAEKAIRWKAPEINSATSTIAKTSEWTSPIIPSVDEPMKSTNLEEQRTGLRQEIHTSASALQATHRNLNSTVTGVAVANPSVDMLQASYDDGYAKGYAEGNAALHQQSVKELNNIISAISQVSTDSQDFSLHEEVVELSIGIARILLTREVLLDTDAMQQLAKAGLDQLPSTAAGTRQVHLHPLDANTVRALKVELPDVQVVDDLALNRGECRITSATSTISCGIEQWLSGMARQLGIIDDTKHSSVDSVTTEQPQ